MQITTVHKLQHILDASLKVLKFIWRHAFVLIVFGMMVAALIIGRISWENCFYLYVGAAMLDWFKMKLSVKAASNPQFQTSSFTSVTPNYHDIGISSPWYRYETLGISRYNY